MNKKDIEQLCSIIAQFDKTTILSLLGQVVPQSKLIQLGTSSLTTSSFTEAILGFDPFPDHSCGVLLQQQARMIADNTSKQPCGETIKTKGRYETDYEGKLTLISSLLIIANAYRIAEEKAKRFCNLLSKDDCKTLKFVKYDFFDSDDTPKKGGGRAMVEIIVVWKCLKSDS